MRGNATRVTLDLILTGDEFAGETGRPVNKLVLFKERALYEYNIPSPSPLPSGARDYFNTIQQNVRPASHTGCTSKRREWVSSSPPLEERIQVRRD